MATMRELKQNGQLSQDWNIKQSGMPKRQSPRLTFYPYTRELEFEEFKGNVVIRDNDGTEWEARFETFESSLKCIEDFRSLCALYGQN